MINLKIIKTFLEDLMFPPVCPSCNRILEPNERKSGFCKECMKRIGFVGSNICVKCGLVVKSADETYCRSCKEHVKSFDVARAAYLYKGPMKDAMYRFKYSNLRVYARTFARDMVAVNAALVRTNGPQAVIAVPMFEAKKKKRGYNQAEVLGRAVAEELKLPFEDDFVIRVEDTRPMKELGRSGRVENLENAFQMGVSGVKYKSVILVDDIYTTGSTVDSVSKVLKRAGVDYITVLTACTGYSE